MKLLSLERIGSLIRRLSKSIITCTGKGFYGRDNDGLTLALRYFGGFYKRFWKIDDKTMRGVTHPFETKIIDARSIATEKEVFGCGKVIHLEYQDAPFLCIRPTKNGR